MIYRFPLTSDECEILLEFEACSQLSVLAEKVGRDHSVIARTLKRLSEKHPVVEKKMGRWILTELGRKVNAVTRTTLAAQVSALKVQSTLRIGTNREFGSRIVATDFESVQKIFSGSELTLNVYAEGSENALLSNWIDLGLDCGRPFSPELSYKLIVDEPIIAVASPEFAKKHKKQIVKDYRCLPHLLYDRLQPDKIQKIENQKVNVTARFNDIAVTRAVCRRGTGWALLPKYSVQQELEDKSLLQIDAREYSETRYGVWWLRSRPYLKVHAEKLAAWLKSKQL